LIGLIVRTTTLGKLELGELDWAKQISIIPHTIRAKFITLSQTF